MIETLSGVKQTIAYGPMASLESIKHLGTNGGGFLGANSSTPFENPTYWSNYAEALSMMLIPGSLVFLFGRMLKTKQQIHPHAIMIFVAMFVMFIGFLVTCLYFEFVGIRVASLRYCRWRMEAKKHVSVLAYPLYLQPLRPLLLQEQLTICTIVLHR